MHFRHKQTDRQTDTDIREMYILHLALKITPKGAWLWSRDLFKFGMAKARYFKFCTVFCQVSVLHWNYKLFLKWARSRSRDVLKFLEISDNISETVQDRDIVTMEDK